MSVFAGNIMVESIQNIALKVKLDTLIQKFSMYWINMWFMAKRGFRDRKEEQKMKYRKTSSISHTKSQNLNASCLLLQ